MANAISMLGGTVVCSSSWTSTMATMAKPDSSADVLLDAFSLARLSCSFRQDR